MDTLREKQILCDFWEKGKAPWRVNNSKKIKNIYPLNKNVQQQRYFK